MTCANRIEATAKLKELTAGYRLFLGTGNPYYKPYAMYQVFPTYYYVAIHPEGDGYMAPCQTHYIYFP